MDPESMINSDLYPDRQPWDVVFDELWVSHSEFWLVAGSGPGADIVSAIPEGDAVTGNGEAIGIPTSGSAGDVSIALSVWEAPVPEGRGTWLGTCRIWAPGRELSFVNVEGREPGPVLVLPEGAEYQVSVWRCAKADAAGSERYDIRVWQCPTSG
ncbi:hypothetical protein GCM10010272_67510 [Streptomyces lateritius]|nr:hypothetical protein GCM10010272_67510 [Streptomyces lateritius]